jgi:hypothetical protein
LKFKVKRARTPSTSKPCEEAEKGYWTEIDDYPDRSFEDYEERTGRSFLAIGINHRVTESGIEREIPNCLAGWVVNLDSLEDLVSFVKTYGDITVHKNNIIEIRNYRDE